MKQSISQITLLSALCLFSLMGCDKSKSESQSGEKAENSSEKTALAEKYTEVPKEELVTGTDDLSISICKDLQTRYAADLLALQKEVSSTGATLVVGFLSPEVGESITQSNKIGVSVIGNLCKTNNIQFYDLTQTIASKSPLEVTQMPKDGHWSKKGAEIVATELKAILAANASVKSTSTAILEDELLGDNTPNEDKISDGGKDMPYRVKTNKQGLRMNSDVAATKTKQRFLFLGDSEMYFPFLDNDFTGTELLQKQHPDKEILNGAMWGYTMKDYLGLYTEKAKKSAADVVVVVTNGNDILDYYFTQRNLMGRNPKATKPTADEEKYYQTFLQK